jgi:hypothetical protein
MKQENAERTKQLILVTQQMIQYQSMRESCTYFFDASDLV